MNEKESKVGHLLTRYSVIYWLVTRYSLLVASQSHENWVVSARYVTLNMQIVIPIQRAPVWVLFDRNKLLSGKSEWFWKDSITFLCVLLSHFLMVTLNCCHPCSHLEVHLVSMINMIEKAIFITNSFSNTQWRGIINIINCK